MPGVIPRYDSGPVTFEVVEAIAGGKLVEARTGGKVGVAAAASIKCLGVATKDATPVASQESTDAFGNAVLNTGHVTEFVAVQGNGATFNVTYAADCAFGVLLKCAANGAVTPWVSGTDTNAALIVGRCTEPAGVVVATKATGLAQIF